MHSYGKMNLGLIFSSVKMRMLWNHEYFVSNKINKYKVACIYI